MSDRTAAMDGLRVLLAAMEADDTIPGPSPCWPLTFHAPESVDSAAALEQFAASLGVDARYCRDYAKEGAGWWAEVQGYVGGIPVRVTADTGARVLDPLPELAVSA